MGSLGDELKKRVTYIAYLKDVPPPRPFKNVIILSKQKWVVLKAVFMKSDYTNACIFHQLAGGR